MKKYIGIVSALAVVLFGVALVAGAQGNVFAIEFPIAELGGCASMQECKLYCDDPEHGKACFAFAQAHGLVKEGDLKKKKEGEKFEEHRRDVLQEQGGPGGCTSEESCKTFCSDPANGEECLAFAKENELRPKDELEAIESKNDQFREKIEAVRAGNGPGGCNSPEACNDFCADPTNRKTCFEFAKEHNLIPPEELARIEKQGFEAQVGPGGCASRKECDMFCRTPSNMQICLDFAIERGQITREQASQFLTQRAADNVRPQVRGPQIRVLEPKIDEEKARQLLETTGGPGGCASFEACGSFCNTPGNDEICFAFAKEHGLMETADVERIEKIRNTEGPGGCRGRACEQYCSQEGHEEECLNFAIDNGLVPPEEIEHAKKFIDIAKQGGPGGCRGRQCENFCNQPENQEQCFAFAKEKGLLPPEEIQKIEKIQGTLKSGGGPGGCTSEQTCRAYCSDVSKFEECAAFAVGAGLMKPEEAMMQLEQFVGAGNHQGFGTGQGGPQGFGQPDQQGFGQRQPQRFGNQGSEGFGQGGDYGTQGQVDAEYQKKFEERFKQFEQFRAQFENGRQPGQGFPGGQGSFPGEGTTQGNFPGGQNTTGTQNRGPLGVPRLPLGEQGTGGMPQGQDTVEGQQFEREMHNQFKNEFNQQFDQQYNKQFEEEMKRQMMQQGFDPRGGMVPPQDGVLPMDGEQMNQPPTGMMPPQGGTFQQPPSGMIYPEGGVPMSGEQMYQPPTGMMPPMMPPPGGDGSGGVPPPPDGGGAMPPPGAFGKITRTIATVLSALFLILK